MIFGRKTKPKPKITERVIEPTLIVWSEDKGPLYVDGICTTCGNVADIMLDARSTVGFYFSFRCSVCKTPLSLHQSDE